MINGREKIIRPICCSCLIAKLCPTLATPWTVAHWAPLSMGFSWQEYYSEFPFLSPGDLPNPGIKLRSPAMAGWFFTCNGNPLQCSCLENPRDGGAWWAAVYGVAQSWTRLKWLSSSSKPQGKILITTKLRLKTFTWKCIFCLLVHIFTKDDVLKSMNEILYNLIKLVGIFAWSLIYPTTS